ncbi:MAG: sialate O-acetylesterase [Candidatus Sulfopaludibacter sp.]|nr:sialate O-acetylesterase [Candidatus Sulfopaludibacter sp.]
MPKSPNWLLVFALAGSLHAAVKLPALISDHMVLQEGVPVRIWGSADPGESVRVEFQGQAVTAKAADNGQWSLWLKPLSAAGPLEMNVNGTAIKDVLVGEVWLGSGQSNMEFALNQANNHEEEIARADYPLIHVFLVKRIVADRPAEDVAGTWQVCTPENAPRFSAVEYFFGRALHNYLHVPMGLIESYWGGTPVESWTSAPALKSDAALQYVGEEWDKVLAAYPAAKATYDQRVATWEKTAAEARAAGKTPPNRPGAPPGPGHPNTPAGLYNGMIAPLTPYIIRGVIWYQGESNANEAHAWRYRRIFAGMIQDWRKQWGEGDFPFLFVQLANFRSNGWWPVLRESQTETLSLRNTGMAVSIDIGDGGNIHPKDKQDAGMRLALVARHVAYHDSAVEYSGPMFRQATPENSTLRVWFSHADGLQAKGNAALTGFTIAGADGKFVPADARIEGATIVVSSTEVASPVAVRYAWADDPVCNLINQAGLPAGPFRSDEPAYAQ